MHEFSIKMDKAARVKHRFSIGSNITTPEKGTFSIMMDETTSSTINYYRY